MHFEPQSVTGGVAERVAEAPRLDRIPRERVGVAARHPRPHPLARPSLRAGDEIVQGALRLRRPRTHDDGAGDVGTVPIHHGAKV